MKKIAIYGAGGFGREVLTLINAMNKVSKEYEFIGFFDDNANAKVANYKVLGGKDQLLHFNEQLGIVFAIGNPKIKREIVNYVAPNKKLTYPILIHPQVIIGEESSVDIGEGTIIAAGNIITCDIKIGKHVILNLSCTIGHDTVIENYASFMPTVNISGEVIIKEGVYVGTGAKIINLVTIGENSIIGAGAVVAKDIPANVTAVGVPAKAIK
ncbi:acetyltransferase [Fulvivirga ulvae]|uniref:acetyltransferase n=1 Tax=Fulvivirga ulvae TaxID=2904245 RepID=UPI001F3A1B0B|nr:acetyltransferase [Fulvivirga ulvae]UII31642.1 acetyltransferase [Fulvivirga ulvae]